MLLYDQGGDKTLNWRVLITVALMAAPAGAGEREPWVAASLNLHGGSATVIAQRGEKAYAISAAHICAGTGKRVAFTCADNRTSGVGEWLAEDEDLDLALLVTSTRDTIGVAPIYRQLQRGRLRACGFPKGKGPEAKGFVWIADTRITNLPARRYHFEVKDGKFRGGDSGGGVFVNGSLISVITHGDDDNEEAYGATHRDILAFLGKQENKTGKLIVDAAPKAGKEEGKEGWDWGDRDRTHQILELWKVVRSQKGKPGPPGPDGKAGRPGAAADGAALAEVRRELAELRQQIKTIRSTPVVVQVLDPKTKKVVAERAYPFGTPIKLILPTKE